MPVHQPLRKNEDGLVWSEVRPARPIASLADDVRDGMLQSPRQLPPKYFYDERGSELFEQICQTAEYYPTRTEDALLQEIASELLARSRPAHIVELGSGSSRKTRRLFDACGEIGLAPVYWPFDVSREMLLNSARELFDDYPWLKVHALIGDYHAGLDHMPSPQGRSLWLFLGGTIGNFSAAEATAFLREVGAHMGPEGQLLLAVDRVKDPARLEAAYNDAGGVTAAFNRNVLNVLNRELDCDFTPDAFEHKAVFNRESEQIEMYLQAAREQTVTVGALDHQLRLAAGETIRTEISRKFTPASLQALLAGARMQAQRLWHAPDEDYTLVLARARSD